MVSSNSARSPLAVTGGGRFGWDAVYTYVRIAPGSLAAVRDALPALIDRHVSGADLRLDSVPAGGERPAATLDAVELEAIRAALARHDGNVVAAADELGLSRSALYRRMEKFGL